MARGYRFGVVGSLSTVPDGKTVLPVNDIDLLLQCAGIKGSTTTTLAELFADTTTLQAVINSNNAIDYLVRSTSFAKQDSVPTMTSNTTPSGECSANTYYQTNYPWLAFDGNNNTMWENTANTNGYICYKFTSVVKVVKANIIADYSTGARVKNFIIQASNDGSTWTDLYTGQYPNTSGYNLEVDFNNTNNYLYYRLFVNDTYTGWIRVKTLQFYTEEGFCNNSTAMTYIGANNYASNTLLGNSTWRNSIVNSTYKTSVLTPVVPTMTDNTTPYGTAICSTYYSTDLPYKAFDNDISTQWSAASSEDNPNYASVGYHATQKYKVYGAYVAPRANVTTSNKIQASNDGVTWVDLCDYVTVNSGNNYTANIDFAYQDEYEYFRVYGRTESAGAGYYMRTAQFYARTDV